MELPPVTFSPVSTKRLIAAKRRVTAACVRSDQARVDAGAVPRSHRWRRTRLHRLDSVLDARGELAPASSWFPGAKIQRGLNAGYRLGRTLGRCAKMHYTVGTNSADLIARKGLAQFLGNRDGTVTQFAEANAVCSDSCEWNVEGWGYEHECLDRGQINPAMIRCTARVIAWSRGAYGGFPIDRWALGPEYGGTRFDPGTFRGVINHDAARARRCDQHFDGVTAAERDAIRAAIGGGASSSNDDQEDEDVTLVCFTTGPNGAPTYWAINGLEKVRIDLKSAEFFIDLAKLNGKNANLGRLTPQSAAWPIFAAAVDKDATATRLIAALKTLFGWLAKVLPTTKKVRENPLPEV